MKKLRVIVVNEENGLKRTYAPSQGFTSNEVLLDFGVLNSSVKITLNELLEQILSKCGFSLVSNVQKSNTIDKLFIHVNESYIAIQVDDIIKCEASGNYTIFYTKDKKEFIVSKLLKYYENLLKNQGFIRVNRSILVNMKLVKQVYKKEAVILNNNERIIVSARNKAKLMSFINKHT
ncbi:LytR/AlgR family response regulator transcription factor [Tenacibaculum jejuense]|nr:LytTR family DNA-binding domain-containing protein [Tenacibaculum jejuense]